MGDAVVSSLFLLAGGIIGSVLSLLGVRMTTRQAATAEKDAHSIAQGQVATDNWEKLTAALQKTAEHQQSQINGLMARVERLERGIDGRDAHIQALRHQIYRGDPPPPVDPPVPY